MNTPRPSRAPLWTAVVMMAAAVLAGCAGTPEVRYTPVDVKVPVIVACVVQVPEEPKWAVDQLSSAADDFEVAKAYRVERRQREQYNRELQAAISACKKGTP